MANGEVCCILGVCCPAGSEKQRAALMALIAKQRPSFSEAQVAEAASRVLTQYGNFAHVAASIDAGALSVDVAADADHA